ncbi:MAG: hypothetical protein KKB45_16925 [Gammaproteobacteria bacterium]|nr:hypothetical protein [Gammaproteobacteria bacterium]
MAKLQILQYKAWWKPLSGVYASSLALRPSRWRHLAYSCGLLLLLCSVLLLPVRGWQLWLGSFPMLIGCYLLLESWKQPLTTTMLAIAQNGELRWLGDRLPQGVLLPQSLICSWGILLFWQDLQQKTQQRWLYQDNFSAPDFRALARHCQLIRWQQRASDSV